MKRPKQPMPEPASDRFDPVSSQQAEAACFDQAGSLRHVVL
jgi:hypothetical protein